MKSDSKDRRSSSVWKWISTVQLWRFPKLRWIVLVLVMWVVYSKWPVFHEQVVRRAFVAMKPCLPPVDRIVEKEFWHSGFGPGRNQSTPQKVTVVIAAYETWGLRPIWMKSIVEKYVSEAYKHIIDQVIVVWNNPDEPPPEFPEAKVLKMTRNSLNNRWVEPVEHVKTDAVLVLDNDVMVDANGLSCMLNWWEKFPDRIVGPYARHVNENMHYFAKDMFFFKAEYKVVLPRVMMLHRSLMALYPNFTRSMEDVLNSKCDDMILNAVVSSRTKKPPLRVQLPPDSIIDYFELCRRTRKAATGGLSSKREWRGIRDKCTYTIQQVYNFPYKITDEVGVCQSDRTHSVPQCRVEAGAWGRMFYGKGCITT